MARKVNFKQAFISRLLGNSTNFPREMKILVPLVGEYPEESFWNSLTLKFKIASLAYFLTDKGAELLRLEYGKFKFQPDEKVHYEIEETVDSGEFLPIMNSNTAKVKSLNDFLKIWKK